MVLHIVHIFYLWSVKGKLHWAAWRDNSV